MRRLLRGIQSCLGGGDDVDSVIVAVVVGGSSDSCVRWLLQFMRRKTSILHCEGALRIALFCMFATSFYAFIRFLLRCGCDVVVKMVYVCVIIECIICNRTGQASNKSPPVYYWCSFIDSL